MSEEKPYDEYIASGAASRLAQGWRNKLCDEWAGKYVEEFSFVVKDGKLAPCEPAKKPSDELKKISAKAAAAHQYLLDIYEAEQSYKKLVAVFDD